MTVPRNRVFDIFLYLIRAGSVLCVLDAVDEAVRTPSLAGFLDLFADLAQTLSAESTVIMSSRYSFLADSPQVRRLLNSSSLVSEQLVQQLHANGVDPLELPHFSIVRLSDASRAGEADEAISPLELRLAAQTGLDPAALPADPAGRLTELVTTRVDQVLAACGLGELRSRLDEVLGGSHLAGRSVFAYADLCTGLGVEVFRGGRVAADAEPLLTEQVRRFLVRLGTTLPTPTTPTLPTTPTSPTTPISPTTPTFPTPPGRVVPAGTYLVGPSHRLLLRTLDRPLQVEEFPVTVARYNEFLTAVARDGCADWDHPDTPPDHTHDPWYERLREPDYYSDPRFTDHPAICINWWSAHAFAAWDGKRLPTCTEWEVAARGSDGRLFPWGENLDLSLVNCADTWSGRPLITYEAWKAEMDAGSLKSGRATPVTDHPGNVSPFGIRGMSGNVWEWTATVFDDINSAAICGGSYDNPARAVQTSSKALYVRRGSSNVVGFRCAKDLP